MYVAVLTGQTTQHEAAGKWKVDRSTVTVICRTAKHGALQELSPRPGRPGKRQVEIEEMRAECERLRATVAEQAVALHLHRGKSRWD